MWDNVHMDMTSMSRGASREGAAGVRQHLLPGDRLEYIADLVRQDGSVRARELVDLLGVTDETIRRDLAKLAELGVVRRAHGGAIASRHRDETTTAVRLREHAEEKIAIGHRAAQLVSPGTTIILDSGTTTLCLARALHATRDLVVVTTAVTNALELVGNPGTTVVMTGGVIRPTTFGASGQLAAATLHELRVDQAFLAIHSVSARGGLTYPTFEEVDAKRAMIDAATEVILLADSSKFGREALVRVARLTAVDRIITSPGVDPAELVAITDLGVEVIIAEPNDATMTPRSRQSAAVRAGR
jgi:DeoR family transcriptional regulator, fructose operon transcriptional repressor